MNSLHDIQTRFANAIFSGRYAEFSGEILEDGEDRLAIYRNNVFGGLGQALRVLYPAVFNLVGESFFVNLAEGYIRAHSSTCGDLARFGDSFPDFLENISTEAGLPYLPDLARLEHLLHLTYHAADREFLDLQRLASVPEVGLGALTFELHPACLLLESNYPVQLIWQLCQPGGEEGGEVDLSAGGVRLLIARTGLQTTIRQLGAGEHALLDAFSKARPFDAACAATLDIEPDFDLSGTLQRLVATGVVVDFREKEET
ncbi:MAG: HvfC/BufC N-terminal domain-containing protein [Burkholderiales bacterium]